MADEIKVAFAGARRSRSFFPAFRAHPDTRLVAVCDVDEAVLDEAAAAAGVSARYTVFERMLDEARPDAVVVATPMQHHASQAIAALERDISVLSEVTACVSMDEARWLVQACGRSRGSYMMAENYTYMKPNVLVRALVQAGLFGDPYYAEGEYLHALPERQRDAQGRPTWRYYWQTGINGATYPTHSLGPCLQWIGERAERVSCIGTGRRTHPEHAIEDTVLLLGKTASGKLIRTRLDMLSQRPHAMTNYALQGTKGAYESARRAGEGNWIWLQDLCDDPNRWVPLESLEAEYLPEIWRDPPAEALQAGHGGGDYFEVMDFVAAVKGEGAPAVGIHEALDMTLPGLVSQQSIERQGEWLQVPDSRLW